MSLTPLLKVRKLQTALHAKAKSRPTFGSMPCTTRCIAGRAGARLRRMPCQWRSAGSGWPDVRRHREVRRGNGWTNWRKNSEGHGITRNRCGGCTYPSRTASKRPLGIPTIKDRVVQTAVMLVLEPIFEADLQPEQYAYRSAVYCAGSRSPVQGLVRSGHTEVVDADLSGYFDSIPHAELMKSVSRRVSDRHLLRLIKMWLEIPVEETDGEGTAIGRPGIGTGEGTPARVAALAVVRNLYIRWFIQGWKALGHEKRSGRSYRQLRGRLRDLLPGARPTRQ